MILRCLHCESEDVLAHARLDYANDSRQLGKNENAEITVRDASGKFGV